MSDYRFAVTNFHRSSIAQTILRSILIILSIIHHPSAIGLSIQGPSITHNDNTVSLKKNSYYTSQKLISKMADARVDNNGKLDTPLATINSITERHPIIQVATQNLKAFVVGDKKEIKDSFVLIINDSDFSTPSDFSINHRDTRLRLDTNTLFNDPKITHFFIMNYTGSKRSNITPIPIGMDYIVSKRTAEYHIKGTIDEQTALLNSISSSAKQTNQRIPKVFTNIFHNTSRRHKVNGYLDRDNIKKQLKNNTLVFFQDKIRPREESWKLSAQYAFVFSPIGKGFDCFRVWESLALGNIVLVQSSPVDHLFKGLPVIPIKNLNEINQVNLNKWLLQYPNVNPKNIKPLFMKYWEEQIHRRAQLSIGQRLTRSLRRHKAQLTLGRLQFKL